MVDLSEFRNWTEYLQLLVGLFAITDPLTAVPTFLSVVDSHTEAEKRRVVLVAAITVLLVLLAFTFLGKAILDLFSISLAAFRIAGGLLLLLLAVDMIRSENDPSEATQGKKRGSATSVGVAPVAIPLLAGPGAISTIIIYTTAHDALGHKILVSGVIITVVILIFIILRFALRIGKVIGPTGMTVFNRIMGLIVASIAIEFILDALAEHFPSLGPIVH